MLNLKAAAAKRIAAYFNSPKSTYEHFINKKWAERKDLDESKQNFLKRAINEWKNASDQQRIEFLQAAPPPANKRSRITGFFKRVDSASSKKKLPKILNLQLLKKHSLSFPLA